VADWYYLAAQLPSFSTSADKAPLPITSAQLSELCSRFFDKRSMRLLDGISLEPPKIPEKTGSPVIDSWNEMENSLRTALALARAQKLGRDFSAANPSIRPEAVQAARAACGMDNPLAAEQSLNEFRIDFLNRIAPVSLFSTESVFVYALKLKLAERARKFNEEAGMASYRTIYDGILGDAK
jgi:hypothetical protein